MTTLNLPLIGSPPMSDRAARSESRVALPLVIALCLFSALLGRLVYVIRPFDHDGSMYIYMGKLISEGGRFWVDLIDNKFPTVGLLTSAAWRAFGANWTGYVLLQAAMSYAGAWLLMDSARRHIGRFAALPTALFALVYMNFSTAVFGGFQLETVQMFFAILAAHAAIEALRGDSPLDAFVVGLAAGCGAMAKPTGLAVGAAFAIVVIYQHRAQWRRILAHGFAALIGLAIPALVSLIYLIQSDTLQHIPAIAHQIGDYAANTAWDAWDLGKPFIVAGFLGVPLLVRGWVCRRHRLGLQDASRSPSTLGGRRSEGSLRSMFDVRCWVFDVRRSRLNIEHPIPALRETLQHRSALTPPSPGVPGEGTEPAREKFHATLLCFALAWLVMETLGAVAQRRMYVYHFLPAAAPAALLFGMIPRKNSARQLLWAMLPMIVISTIGAGEIIRYAWRHDSFRSPASDYLSARAPRGAVIWQDLMARTLIETDLRPGSRILLTFLFVNSDTAPLKFCNEIIKDLEWRKPDYILLPTRLEPWLDHQVEQIADLRRRPLREQNYRDAWRKLEAWVKARYVFEAHIARETVYRRDEEQREMGSAIQ